MERLTKKELGKTTSAVMCTYTAEQCNDSCMYGMCKWNKKALLKLKEYEDAEEQELLIKFPCVKHTRVYSLIRNSKWDSHLPWHEKGLPEELKTPKNIIISRNFVYDDIEEIGKSVFLTEAEAEQALKDAVKE